MHTGAYSVFILPRYPDETAPAAFENSPVVSQIDIVPKFGGARTSPVGGLGLLLIGWMIV